MDKKASVRWQDGSHDPYGGQKSEFNPKYPFGTDNYREVSGPSYHEWMEMNSPFGRDEDGCPNEAVSANPDVLSDEDVVGTVQPFRRDPSITDDQVDLMDQAYSTLTDKQKQVWQLCIRDGFTEAEAGRVLGVTRQAIYKLLSAAKLVVSNFLRENGPEQLR